MSLINDALKKAARQRAEEQGEVLPPMPGTRRASSPSGPMKKQTLVLVIAAAVALVVVSVVVTGVFMTGKPETKPAMASNPTPEMAAPAAAPKVVVAAPVVAVSLPSAAVAAPAVVTTPVPTSAQIVAAATTPLPTPTPVAVVAEQTAPAAKASAPAQSHTDMVQGIVDGFHVSGVRTAGAGSKALVDGHIYKLNDIVDKSVGLKLTKVDEDHLTFVDRDGNTYVRNF